jgi:hypothetical protein
VASAFERVVLTGAQMSGDVARQPRCGRVELGWGRQKKGGGLTCRHLASLPASFIVVVALVLRDVALACRWVVISKRRGGRQRRTYLASRWSSEREGRATGRSGGGGGKEGTDVVTDGGRFQIWARAGRWTAG